MAEYWASKNSLPTPTREVKSPEYLSLEHLINKAKGLAIAQGQVDILGAIEMLCSMQYHYQNFVRKIGEKGSGTIDLDAPDERYEIVAYINRIGQFCYFSNSPFVRQIFGKSGEDLTPSAHRLLVFRHKYSAHRERDKPRKNSGEARELGGELALGALGGFIFSARRDTEYENVNQASSWQDDIRVKYRDWFVSFQIFKDGDAICFTPEAEHPAIMSEASTFLRHLIDLAKNRPT